MEEQDESLRDEPVITDQDFVLGIRPEAIAIDADTDGHLNAGSFDATIYGAMPTGMESTLKLRVGEYLLTSVIFGGSIYRIGENARLRINGDSVLLFDRRSGRLVTAGRLEIL